MQDEKETDDQNHLHPGEERYLEAVGEYDKFY
jgi:hypothetical protein